MITYVMEASYLIVKLTITITNNCLLPDGICSYVKGSLESEGRDDNGQGEGGSSLEHTIVHGSHQTHLGEAEK